ESHDPRLKSRAYHNLGNTHYLRQRWDEAIAAYRRALQADPQNDAARYNLEMALRQRPEQPPQGGQQQGQQGQQQGQQGQQPGQPGRQGREPGQQGQPRGQQGQPGHRQGGGGRQRGQRAATRQRGARQR